MSRYFFHCTDNVRDLDREGTVMADDAAAEVAAIAFAGETLKHSPKLLREKGQWRVEVTDQQGALLYTVITIAVDAPKPGSVPAIAGTASND